MKETPTAYARAFLELTQDTPARELGGLAARFWQAVFRRRRFAWRRQIQAEVTRLWQEQHGETAVHVATARGLTPAQQRALERSLAQALEAEVALELELKPHLLAGLVVTVVDRRYDASLKGRLDALYRRLAGSTG